MAGYYSPDKLRAYPHMMVGDVRIWDVFLDTVSHGFDRFQYDVHVGEGLTPSPNWEEIVVSMAMALTEKRIDVVGWNKNVPTIIEVKPFASLSAVGQVLCYRELFRVRFPQEVSPLLMIVTDQAMPDMAYLTTHFGIIYINLGIPTLPVPEVEV